MPLWRGQIRPFRDRPDLAVDYVWYAVPQDREALPYKTPFVERFWEFRERWPGGGVGTVPGSLRVIPGVPPDPAISDIEGTKEQWERGFLYSDYLAGNLPVGRCVPVPVACANCPLGTATPLYATITGWQDSLFYPMSLMNGVYSLSSTGACVWKFGPFSNPLLPGPITLTFTAGSGLQTLDVSFQSLGTGVQFTASSDWDCLHDTYVYSSGSSITTGTPPFNVLISRSPFGREDDMYPGQIFDYAGPSAPAGSVPCDGAAYPIVSPYDRLFAAIGHAFDTYRGQSAPPSGQFRVPLLTGLVRAASGAAHASSGPTDPATSAHAARDMAGVEAAALAVAELPAHTHPVTDPGHSHTVPDPGHTHSVSDPGHNHPPSDGSNPLTDYSGGSLSQGAGGSAMQAEGPPTAATGISLGTAATGITGTTSDVTGITGTGSTGSSNAVSRVQPTYYGLVCIKL